MKVPKIGGYGPPGRETGGGCVVPIFLATCLGVAMVALGAFLS